MRVAKRRRREGKTDYRAREIMLKAGMSRIVFRKTSRYIIGQYVKSEKAQDSVVVFVNSKKLIDYGWPEERVGSLKSLPAAYLTGFLLGKKIMDVEEKPKAIFDLGLVRNIKKSRAYAFLKGVVDAGVSVPCDSDIFPDDERIKGKHIEKIKEIFNKVKESIEKIK